MKTEVKIRRSGVREEGVFSDLGQLKSGLRVVPRNTSGNRSEISERGEFKDNLLGSVSILKNGVKTYYNGMGQKTEEVWHPVVGPFGEPGLVEKITREHNGGTIREKGEFYDETSILRKGSRVIARPQKSESIGEEGSFDRFGRISDGKRSIVRPDRTGASSETLEISENGTFSSGILVDGLRTRVRGSEGLEVEEVRGVVQADEPILEREELASHANSDPSGEDKTHPSHSETTVGVEGGDDPHAVKSLEDGGLETGIPEGKELIKAENTKKKTAREQLTKLFGRIKTFLSSIAKVLENALHHLLFRGRRAEKEMDERIESLGKSGAKGKNFMHH
ncbi:MAG: hypothetical protein LBU15_01650 [Rickettsiales bacterium]|jgi:hypothetical protein|nr:hypothetical protein [Rickettsiales bacterium]